jgi:hypothetical protein
MSPLPTEQHTVIVVTWTDPSVPGFDLTLNDADEWVNLLHHTRIAAVDLQALITDWTPLARPEAYNLKVMREWEAITRKATVAAVLASIREKPLGYRPQDVAAEIEEEFG